MTEQKKFGDPGSVSIQQQTAGICGCMNPRMAENQHRQQKLGIRRMQESTDGENPTQTTKIGYPRDAGIHGWQASNTRQQKLGIRGIQESNNRQRDSADAGIRGLQEFTQTAGIRRSQESTEDRMSKVRGWGQDTVTRNQRVPRGEPRVRFVGYGHQEPTGFRGKNRGCGSQDTVTRNQRGSEGRHDVSQL